MPIAPANVQYKSVAVIFFTAFSHSINGHNIYIKNEVKQYETKVDLQLTETALRVTNFFDYYQQDVL